LNFDIGEILARASQITWRHKVLWVFNMFPILFGFLFLPAVFIPMFFLGPYSLFRQASIDPTYYLSLLGSIDLLVILLSILLYVVGAAASSLGILRVENGRPQLPFRDLLQDGLEYFWRILSVTVLVGGAASLVLLPVFSCMTLFGVATRGLGLTCLVPLLFFLYPAMLMAYSLAELSQAAVIADNRGIRSAISRSWALMRLHFWPFVRFSLVLYLGVFLLSLIFLLPLGIPFLFLFLRMQGPLTGFNAQRFGESVIVLCLVLLPILALVQGVTATFIRSAFMDIYLRLTRSTVLQTALQ
jgi:hypothetical protein